MSGGIVFDLYALAFAACVGIVAWLIYLTVIVVANKDRPHDWEKDWPEYRHCKETHVRLR